MKKILAIVLALSMVLSMCAVNLFVSAANEPTITVESAEAEAGDTVSLAVVMGNNPGIWGADLRVTYDDTVLTLDSVTNGEIFGAGEVTAGDLSKVPYVLSYARNDFSDTTANGTVATLNFTVNANAEPGDYAVTLSYTAGDICNAVADDVNFELVAGKVTIPGEAVKTGKITGATVDVGATLTINYYASTDCADDVIKFTSSSGKVTVVEGVLDTKTGYYKFAYEGINPQCMSDLIKAELMHGDEVLDVKENYSVKAYCENQIGKSAAELKLTVGQFDVLKTLLADMLTYGSASQEYRNYNTENLADDFAWVSQYKSVFTKPEGVRIVNGNADANNKAISVGLNMANVNRIYFKVKLTDDVVVKINDVEVDKSTFVNNGKNTYTIYSDDIFATQFEDVYTLTLVKDGEVITTVKYNVNAYVATKYNTSGLEDIVQALSNYGKSASAYNKVLLEGDFDLGTEDEL